MALLAPRPDSVHCSLHPGLQGPNSGVHFPPNIMSHFLLRRFFLRAAMRLFAAWLFPAGKGVGCSSMWTLSIHDQWRGLALYTKLSRRAGLFYSQPCGFKQIAQTGELKQILSYRSKTWRETGRNKLCIKAVVSFSPGQSYTGYNVTLPKATINS